MASTYEPIVTYTPGTVSSLTFSSIPSTYTDLRLVVFANTATNLTSLTPRIQFNGDTAANYSSMALTGTGSAVAATPVTGDTGIRLVYGSGGNTYAFLTWDIFSYRSSTYKSALATQSNDNNGSGAVTRTVGTWRNTAAITSITVTCNASETYDTGSVFTLYGILKA